MKTFKTAIGLAVLALVGGGSLGIGSNIRNDRFQRQSSCSSAGYL